MSHVSRFRMSETLIPRARADERRKLHSRWAGILIGVTFLLIGGGTVAVIAIVVLTPLACRRPRPSRRHPGWRDPKPDSYCPDPA